MGCSTIVQGQDPAHIPRSVCRAPTPLRLWGNAACALSFHTSSHQFEIGLSGKEELIGENCKAA